MHDNLDTCEKLDMLIQNVGGRPVVLEALWDGDFPDGWFLYFQVYTETGWLFWKKLERYYLGELSLGKDIRLFNGSVPPWPEAELAKEFAQQAKAKYGLTFWFPSEEPDNDCPSWIDRHRAIACADCGKLIIPTTSSPYLPKNICYQCHLRRERLCKQE